MARGEGCGATRKPKSYFALKNRQVLLCARNDVAINPAAGFSSQLGRRHIYSENERLLAELLFFWPADLLGLLGHKETKQERAVQTPPENCAPGKHSAFASISMRELHLE